MPEPKFREIQYAFTAHLRDPAGNPRPAGVDKRRADLYCELVFANIRNFVSDNFPVLRKLFDDAAWEAIVRDYVTRHLNRTPLFSRLALEFLDYLEKERDNPDDPPFLWELAHYEWMESALRIDMREVSFEGVDRGGDLLEGRPVLNPLAWPLAYRFPVHRIAPGFQPQEAPAQPTYLIIYRNDQDQIGFVELNPVAARLVELLGKEPRRSGRGLLAQIASELKHPSPDIVVNGGRDIMQQWCDRQILLGTRRP